MLRSVLDDASVFNGFKKLIGGRCGEIMADRYIRARPGDAILDIGCGTASILTYFPDVRYVGFDPSADYIATARKRFRSRGQFYRGDCSHIALSPDQRFDLVLAIGVLHHVDDAEALSILRFARSVLKSTGRFFSFDGCFAPSQPFLARWLLRLDRGRHVRTEAAYRALAQSVFPNVEIDIQHHLLRVPYTHILMQCSPEAGSKT